MDITNSLLVAIMFVVILTLGIANLLVALTGVIDRRLKLTIPWVHVSWLVLLLLIYFNLFWHTLDLLNLEEWSFGEFLYVIAGPLLLFFASSLILPDTSGGESGDVSAQYSLVSPQFFSLIALVQIWVIGADLLLGRGFTLFGGFNVVAGALAVVLALSKDMRLHAIGTVFAWILFGAAVTLAGIGVVN